jgi:GAF domain-containing protein
LATDGVVLTTEPDTSIASHGDHRRRLAERAGLRHVAALVARGVSADQLLEGVIREIAESLEVATVVVTRRQADGRSLILASLGDPATAAELAGPARRGPAGSEARVPIRVGGSEWGAICVRSTAQPLDAEAERTLASFAQLVAITTGTDDAGDELRPLVREQAALQRAANDLAERVSTGTVSLAIAEEIAGALKVPDVTLCLYAPDGSAVIVASTSADFPAGHALPDHEKTPTFGIASAIGAPIVIGARPGG